ncbi:glycosyltransferase family 4 protein [candidate division KSB1 bacterium]
MVKGIEKRVLFLGLHHTRKSGVPKVQIELADALRNQGVSVDDLSTQTIPGHDFIESSGSTTHFSSLDHFLDYAQKKHKSYDVIHVHSWAWSSTQMPSGGLDAVKNIFDAAGVVYTFHSIKDEEILSQESILRQADVVHHLTKVEKSLYDHIFHPALQYVLPPSVVIPNMVTTIDADPDKVAELRSRIAPKDEVILLYVGRLEEEKGVIGLSDAFKIIDSKYKGIKLVIVGDGSESRNFECRERMKKELEGYNNVLFTGWVSEEEVAEYQSIASLQLAPSHYEPFGLAPAKGLLNQCVTAVSDIPTFRDLYHLGTQDQLAIPISPAGSAEGIVDAVETYLKEPQAYFDMAKRGQKEMASRYSPERIAKAYINIYDEVSEVKVGSITSSYTQKHNDLSLMDPIPCNPQ